MKKLWLLFLLIPILVHPNRGIIVACNDYYFDLLSPSLEILRNYHECTLPIEVWYSGSELSEDKKEKLSRFAPITFCNLLDHYPGDQTEYWGYQIKALMLASTSFDEVLLIDADVYFFQNPEKGFDFQGYKDTGAYFFKDRVSRFFFFKATHKSLLKYKNRREFLLKLIDQPSRYMPEDWTFYWDANVYPTTENPLNSEHGESGFIVFDKRKHKQGLKNIERLNLDFRTTYKLVLGDKETYWIGLEMAHEPYWVNTDIPKILYERKADKTSKVGTVQFVEGKLFYQQKTPINVEETSIFVNTEDQEVMRTITKSEYQVLNALHFFYVTETLTSRN